VDFDERGMPKGKNQEEIDWYIDNCDSFQGMIEDFILNELKKEKPDQLEIQQALYDLGKLKTVSYLKEHDLIEHIDKIL
jgi:hypothetical protein